MASLQARVTKGIKYYSIVESFRDDNGIPRNRIIQYLGTAENILNKIQGGEAIKSYSHGLISSLITVANELDIVELINNSILDRKIRGGITVGASLVLVAFSRVYGYYSKKGWQSWNEKVSLETILKKDLSHLDSDHFWQHMHCVTEEEIEVIQQKLFKKAISLHECKPETLLLDATNFFTFIDSDNKRCTMAQRGKNKQKRNDLRQISTVLIVTREELLPVYHSAYEGNINDVTMFKKHVESIINKTSDIFPDASVEFIFDKGNLSKNNLDILDKSGFLYTTSIPKNWIKSVIQNNSQAISKGEIVDCVETMWEKDRRFIVYRSKDLLKGQLKELKQNILKIKKTVKALNNQPVKRKSRIDKSSDLIKNCKYAKEIFTIEENSDSKVSCILNLKKVHKLIRLNFGIIILTTNTSASTEVVIKNYQSQFGVESVFSIMKNSVPFRPFYHWTDSKIKVHILICLIAYILITSLHLKTKKLGNDYSIQKLIDKLDSIRLVLAKSGQSAKFNYSLEEIQDAKLNQLAKELGISGKKFRKKVTGFSVYN